MVTPSILHIDFDSFFASVEQQDNPNLRNKPVGITATNGRTAIIAASREAKKLGIPNVTRTYDAYQICPRLTVVPAHFWRYAEVSKQFIKVCNQFAPVVEIFSIDEVFMDVSLTVKLFGGVDALIRLFKQKIKQEVGEYITVSVGVSYNKLLAKLASGINKPNGVYTITPENLVDTYKNCKLTDICGIGNRTAIHLNKIGIYSLLQLRSTSLGKLVTAFGNVEGHFLYDVGQGENEELVKTYTTAPEAKSVGRNYCLPHNEYNKRIIYQNIFELCEEVALKLRRLEKKAQTVGLSLRGSENFYATQTVTEFIDSGSDLFKICRQLLSKDTPYIRSILESKSYVRMVSIWASSLTDSSATPLSLFEPIERKSKTQRVIDAINDKFGDHTIRNGYLLYANKLTTVPNGFGTDRWERNLLSKFS